MTGFVTKVVKHIIELLNTVAIICNVCVCMCVHKIS